jgi:hypothetical protein
MKHIVFNCLSTLNPVGKRVPATPPGEGFTTHADGWERIYTEVALDTEVLHAMARRAAGNARGVSVDGPLKVRVIKRERA